MHYPNGSLVRLNDRVLLINGEGGTVVLSADTDEYQEGYPKEDWSLEEGILIRTDAGALVHFFGLNQHDFLPGSTISERVMEQSKLSSELRPLSETERALIQKMIEFAGEGKNILSKQTESCLVHPLDEYGSLGFQISASDAGFSRNNLTISAYQIDNDTIEGAGPYINLILFVNDGKLKELQIFKDDGNPILSAPDSGKLLFV